MDLALLSLQNVIYGRFYLLLPVKLFVTSYFVFFFHVDTPFYRNFLFLHP